MVDSPHAPAPLAARTFAIGLGIDVATAVTLVLATQVGDLEWTKTYWIALGLMLGRSIVQATVAGLVRRLVPSAAR